MGISKIVIFFVILGLATCGADKCDLPEFTRNIQACGTSMTASVQAAGNDQKTACSGLKTFKSCMADAAHGCDGAITSGVDQGLAMFKVLEDECVRLGYSHASSTSVVNIALLIAAVATLVPFV